MNRRWIIGALAVVLAGCSATASSPAASAPATVNTPRPAAATVPPATPPAVGSTLCGALTALKKAQNEHASPLATYLADSITTTTKPSSADRAQALAHAAAIAATFLEWGPKLDGLKSAELAPLIVALKRAYVGYGEGVTLLKPIIEGKEGDMLTGLTTMREGRDSLGDAINQVELLDASGSLDCSA